MFIDKGTKLLSSYQDGETFIQDVNYINRDGWTKVNPVLSQNRIFFCPFTVDPHNDKTVYMGGGLDIWICRDITAIPLDGSFTTKTEYWDKISSVYSPISALGVSKEIANILYFGTMDGKVYRINDPEGTDSETIRISEFNELSNGYVSCIAVDPHNAYHAIVTFSNYGIISIFATFDGGETWINISGNLEENTDGTGSGPSVKWISILPENGSNTYFTGTSTGLYSTKTLNGINTEWFQEGANTIGNVIVEMVVTREIDGEVIVATHGNGIYSRDYSTHVEQYNPKTPTKFELLHNYPNPFNPSTTISFSLPKNEYVSLEIFNSLGQRVRLLLKNSLRPSGQNLVLFDGMNDNGLKLSSGVYFYRLTVNGITQTRRMTIIK
ncbi:T9SS type A sorting domain-containing protein [candidate division KSB1 bacterium]